MAIVMVGVPTALFFWLALAGLPDPLLSLEGQWRAPVVGPALGLIAAIVLNLVSRNARRRRSIGELARPMIGFAFLGLLLGVAWALLHVVDG